MKADDIMKLHIKSTQSDNSTRQSSLYFEHVDSHFLDPQTPKSQKSVYKGARISKPYPSPSLPNINNIENMLLFMYEYIEKIVDVEGDDNYSFHVVLGLLSKGEEDH